MMQFCSQEVVFDKLGFHLPLTTGWLPLFSAHLLSFQASTFGITNRRFIWEKLVQCCRSCCCCCRIANWRFRHSTVLPVFLRLIYWLYYTNNYRPIVPIKSPVQLRQRRQNTFRLYYFTKRVFTMVHRLNVARCEGAFKTRRQMPKTVLAATDFLWLFCPIFRASFLPKKLEFQV